MPVRYHSRRPVADVPWAHEPSLIELARWADFHGADHRRRAGDPPPGELPACWDALWPGGLSDQCGARPRWWTKPPLVQALADGRLAGAGLDVFEKRTPGARSPAGHGPCGAAARMWPAPPTQTRQGHGRPRLRQPSRLFPGRCTALGRPGGLSAPRRRSSPPHKLTTHHARKPSAFPLANRWRRAQRLAGHSRQLQRRGHGPPGLGLADHRPASTAWSTTSACWACCRPSGTTSTVPVVRVPWLEPGILMKSLDAGAYAVICPMVNSREDAQKLVAWTNYAPRGTRSFGPVRATPVCRRRLCPARQRPRWCASR